jgi:hypothetical protein
MTTTHTDAVAELYGVLWSHSVRYELGGELLPRDALVAYGAAVDEAAQKFLATSPSPAQVAAVAELCHWVAFAAVRPRRA